MVGLVDGKDRFEEDPQEEGVDYRNRIDSREEVLHSLEGEVGSIQVEEDSYHMTQEAVDHGRNRKKEVVARRKNQEEEVR